MDTQTPPTESTGTSAATTGENTRLLLVDDDAPLRKRLAKAMEKRGYDVVATDSVTDAIAQARAAAPGYAVVDLRLADGHGLDIVNALNEMAPDCRVVMLTGYGNIASAVSAVKAGAVDYLSKPADADQVHAALRQDEGESLPPPPENPMSADRVRWEHIQRVYEQCERNVSETARRLRMHRRTLQRILTKHAPHD